MTSTENTDDNIAIQEDVSADTQVLLNTIDGMMKIINTQAEIYNDARKRLVNEHLKKPKLSIHAADAFYIEPTHVGPDLKLLGQKLSLLGSRIKQMNEEREKSQEQTEKAFKQLNDENAHLHEELTRLRNLLYSPSKKASDPNYK